MSIENRKVMIVSDSTCDLSDEILEERKIDLVPLHVVFSDKETYNDRVDINLVKLYEKVEKENIFPKTAAVSTFEFNKFFNKYIEKGYDIFYTGLSSKLSCTYQNALIAAEEFPKGRIEIVDSGNLSTGIGLLLLKACDLRDAGKNVHEIATAIKDIVPRVRTQFVIDSLEYLHKGGRCSGTLRFVGKMIRLKPIILVRDGGMSVGPMAIGAMRKGLNTLINVYRNDYSNVDEDYVFITHSVCNDSADYIQEQVNQFGNNIKHYLRTMAGCVIGSHCGPRCIGILYIVKK